MCSTGKCAKCVAQVGLGDPGRDGLAGTIPNITINATLLAPDAVPVGEALPVIRSGSLQNPVFNVGIPRGLPGSNGTNVSVDDIPVVPGPRGTNCHTSLTNAFVQPAINGTITITVGSTEFMTNGAWLHINPGGVYRIVSEPLSPVSIQVRNPGAADGFPSGVPGNLTPGTSINSNSQPQQVIITGRPAVSGDPGPAGDAPVIVVAYAVPSAPPASPNLGFVFVANAAPPARATSFVPYSWNGSAWIAGPQLAALPGAKAFFGSFDPNVSDPAGSIVGDYMFRYSAAIFTLYEKTGVSTWASRGFIPWPGSVTQTVTPSAPGTYAIGLEYFGWNIRADKDITLNWSDLNYGDQGQWTVVITNIALSNINATFTAGRWQKGPGLTAISSLPVTLTPGQVMVLTFVKNSSSGLYVITNAFLPAAVV